MEGNKKRKKTTTQFVQDGEMDKFYESNKIKFGSHLF